MAELVWHVSVGGVQYGPVTEADLVGWIRDGRVGAADWAWSDEARAWVEVSKIPRLEAHLPAAGKGLDDEAPPAAAPAETAEPETSLDDLIGRVVGTEVHFDSYKAGDERQAIRLPFPLVLVYHVTGSQARRLDVEREGPILNLSPNGLGFEAHERIARGAYLETEIRLPIPGPPIKAKVEVVRVQKRTEDDCFEVGCVYVNMTPHERDRLFDGVRHILQMARESGASDETAGT